MPAQKRNTLSHSFYSPSFSCWHTQRHTHKRSYGNNCPIFLRKRTKIKVVIFSPSFFSYFCFISVVCPLPGITSWIFSTETMYLSQKSHLPTTPLSKSPLYCQTFDTPSLLIKKKMSIRTRNYFIKELLLSFLFKEESSCEKKYTNRSCSIYLTVAVQIGNFSFYLFRSFLTLMFKKVKKSVGWTFLEMTRKVFPPQKKIFPKVVRPIIPM